MPKERRIVVTGIFVCAALAGCRLPPEGIDKAKVLPAHVEGTVAEHAGYVGFSSRAVQGYGLVLGLGENGSAEIPTTVRRYLKEYLEKQKLGSWRHGTPHLEPERILRDPDTAAVLIGGEIPFGAPMGSRFDLQISALAGTQTQSLDGGRLMPAELRLTLGGRATPGTPVYPWAMGGGEIFLDPFVDLSKPARRVRLREGRVIRGGKVTKSRPIRLVLSQPSYAQCRVIEERINQRFRDREGTVARAKNDSTIELRIPVAYHYDYEHFLKLILRLPLRRGASAGEVHARRMIQAMLLPDAQHEQLAMVLEAMGRQMVPMLQPHYDSKDAYVGFYAARTGLRLGDDRAASTVLRVAKMAGSPLQIRAIREFRRHPSLLDARPILGKLLDDESDLVRVAAYDALLEHGDHRWVRRIPVGEFNLDLITSRGRPVVRATQSGEATIALFGAEMSVKKPAFFTTPDDLVTLSSVEKDGESKLMVYRKIARGEIYSDPFHTDLDVHSLIRALGSPSERGADGQIGGLSLTYGQVLRVLNGMCKSGCINAKFILQRPVGIQRILQGAETVGRPDTPEEGSQVD